jgi:phage gp45-like
MIALEVEVYIEHLQVGYFLIYAAEATDAGSSSKEVSHDLRNKSVKEETSQSVERMECYGMLDLPAKGVDCGYTNLTQWNGVR